VCAERDRRRLAVGEASMRRGGARVGNPLVAQAQSSTTWYTGLGLVEDAAQVSSGIQNDSWVDGTLGTVGGALDIVGMAIDPLGSLVAWGVSWLMEHVKPLKDALDWLAGNPDEISAHAQTWENVAKYTLDAQHQFSDAIKAETADWVGPSGDAYRQHAGTHLTVMEGISKAAHGIHYGVMGAGLIVGLVRGIVRDLIAQFIGTLAARLPQWLAEAGLTLGLGTPVVIGQVVALVSKWVNKIQGFLRALLSSLKKLIPMLNKLGDILTKLKELLRKLSRSGPGSPSRDTHLFHSDADPLRAHGSAFDTHPEEVQRMIDEARAHGVDIQFRDGDGMAYGPAPSPGSPGVMVMDRNASYGAWLHEFSHMHDDIDAGFPGMRGWFTDPEVRAGSEIRAYDAEIKHAEEIGDLGAAEKLKQLRDEEISKIRNGE
jgi:hypothetical protein